MVALAIKTMEIVAARIDGPHPGRQGAMRGAGKRQTPDPQGAYRPFAIDQRKRRALDICRDERPWLY
jgi:hypothetical protein